MSNKVFAYIDHFQGTPTVSSWETVGAARKVAEALGGGVTAVVVGHQVEGVAKEAFEHGADEVLLADAPGLKDYRAEAYAGVVAKLASQGSAQVLLMPTSSRTRELAAMVAVDLETGVTPDGIGFEVKDGLVVVTRPIYAGKLLTKEVCGKAKPHIITLRSRAFPKPEATPGRSGTLTRVEPAVEAATEVVEYKAAESGVSLTDAAVIVSGGRGVSNNPKLTPPADLKDEKQIEVWKAQQGFGLIRGLASVLKAAVGASRAAVDAGYVLREPGGPDRQGRVAGPVHRLRHLRRHPASGRDADLQDHCRHQQGCRGADLQVGALRRRWGSVRHRPGLDAGTQAASRPVAASWGLCPSW